MCQQDGGKKLLLQRVSVPRSNVSVELKEEGEEKRKRKQEKTLMAGKR